MNKSDHTVNNNINNKYQCNYAIEYELKFDNTFSLSSDNKDPLPLVSVSLRGVKIQRVTIIAGLICLWNIVANDSMIRRRHTKRYE